MVFSFDDEHPNLVQSNCVCCGVICDSAIVTGSRKHHVCYGCLENGNYAKLERRRKQEQLKLKSNDPSPEPHT